MAKNYKDLEIYQLSYKLALEIHALSLKLPKYEQYEEGSQIRRSSKSVSINIAEGFGRRRYKNDFIKFLIIAHSSCDETKVHLNFLKDTNNINQKEFEKYHTEYDKLGSQIYNFIKAVEKVHNIHQIDK